MPVKEVDGLNGLPKTFILNESGFSAQHGWKVELAKDAQGKRILLGIKGEHGGLKARLWIEKPDLLEAVDLLDKPRTVSDLIEQARNTAPDRADYAIAVWHVDDVIGRAKERGIKLTKAQAREIISRVDRKADAEVGINWLVLDAWTDIVLGEVSQCRK